ncbi:chromosomal organization and DNA repair protein [Colletotrichum truncatum]|uniref:Chromosomal organization and DNA repair protein n=1 Tax=Colletotrichum truncatum TaxID=5467 RepID=A0ACC3ZCG2_COLTU|nr:chromosomal organization and DNA repair protein [Colletotrichum truncatum]KAF6797768.1 chromosomal organization and DNA repair protein [Colletotrichum truncatum]
MPILDRRRPTQRRPERRVVDEDDDIELPPYEPLACPLTNEAKRAIAELSNSRDVHRYQNHIKSSITNLSQSVADINDVTRERHEMIKRLAAKRAESESQEKSQREDEVEEHTAALDAEVPRLTKEAEAAVRDLIDRQVQLDDDKAALAETVDYYQQLPAAPSSRSRRRTRHRAEDVDGEDGGAEEGEELAAPALPDQSVIDTLRQHRDEKVREYEKMNAYQRYAVNNDYAGFKKLWHDAVHGDTGAPLPNAKRWFDDAGNPVMPRTVSGDSQDVKNEGEGAEDDEDEDVVIAGEVRDYRCPLSMQEYKEPYSNRMCSHTYEKEWIVDMLRKQPNKRSQCVVPGCSKEFGLEDFYHDDVILRKMKRAQQLQRLAEEGGSSSVDEDGDDDNPQEVRRRKLARSQKRKVEEIDDE